MLHLRLNTLQAQACVISSDGDGGGIGCGSHSLFRRDALEPVGRAADAAAAPIECEYRFQSS